MRISSKLSFKTVRQLRTVFLSLVILIFTCQVSQSKELELPYKGTFAAKAIDLENNEVIYDHNASTPLVPASGQKLLTLYSAINLLDVEEEISTSVYYEGRVAKGVLKGDLYIKFRGDPSLEYDDLYNLLQSALRKKKIKTIKGDVYIDDTEFDDEYFGPGWAIDQTKFCWSAPISSAVLNENCFEIGVKKNSYGKMALDPSQSKKLININNDAIETNVDKFCSLELKAYRDNSYNIYGCYQRYNLPSTLKIAVQDPRMLSEAFIREFLTNKGVKFKKLKYDHVPVRAKEIASHKSEKIKDHLIKMTKESNNMIAEAMYKKISLYATGHPGSWKNSSIIIKDFLYNDLEFSRDELVLHDGSGLSRKNLISPNVFVEILKNAYHDKKIFKYFYHSLAVAGDDGTLNYRFKKSKLKCKVFAKTGSLDGVSSLTGYAFLENGKKIAFSIIYNNFTTKGRNVKRFEEKVLEDMIDSIS